MQLVQRLIIAALGLGLGVGLAALARRPDARERARQALDQARARLSTPELSSDLREQTRRLVATARMQLRKLPGAGPQPSGGLLDATRSGNQAPLEGAVAGILNKDGDNRIVTQRVRTRLGREQALDGLPHFNVDTVGDGVVYLRGVVRTDEQRQLAEIVAAATEGVTCVVNELTLESNVGA